MHYAIFRKILAVLFGLVLTATGLWAAGAEEEPAAAAEKEMVLDPTTGEMVTAPEYGGTFTFPIRLEPQHMDTMYSHVPGLAISGVAEKLGIGNWGIDRDEFNFSSQYIALFAITGGLAESWELPDPATYVFKIRQGVHWHDKAPMNGRALTAKDIEYNYHRYLALGSGFTEPSPWALSGVRELPWESITATDDATVVMKLKKPLLPALVTILDAAIFMLPPEVIQQYGDAKDWRNFVGTGALHADRLGRRQLDHVDEESGLLGHRRKIPPEPLALRGRVEGPDYSRGSHLSGRAALG